MQDLGPTTLKVAQYLYFLGEPGSPGKVIAPSKNIL